MKCVIVDDEPRAIAVLERYVKKTEGLELLASFDRPLEALSFLKNNHPDCIFLDINMPDLNGLQFSELLKNASIIFTTAYPEYALESYELNAVDYLLKPIAFPRFLKAVEKIRKSEDVTYGIKTDEVILIKNGTKTYHLLADEIIHLESQGNNILFHTINGIIITRMTITKVLELLPINRFLRIHKSFLVHVRQISIIESHQITTKNKVKLPIGANYRSNLEKYLMR